MAPAARETPDFQQTFIQADQDSGLFQPPEKRKDTMHSRYAIAAAMLLLPLAALEARAHRPDPCPEDFRPLRPVYRVEQLERIDLHRDGPGTGWGPGAGAGWATGWGMDPRAGRRYSHERYDEPRRNRRDSDGDGVPDRWDRRPHDPSRR